MDLRSSDAQTFTDHTAFQDDRHISQSHVDLGIDSLDTPHPSLRLGFFFYPTGRWGGTDVSRSPCTPGPQGGLLSPFLTENGATQARKPHQVTTSIQPGPTPDPRAGFHPDLQAPAQLPWRIWIFLTIKGQACLSWSPLPAPLGERRNYF